MSKKDLATLYGMVGILASTPGVFDTVRPCTGPSKGSGSGRKAKCKGCGVTGTVETGKDGKRHINGCQC